MSIYFNDPATAYPDDYPEEIDLDFADPCGRSALRTGPRVYPCPTCGRARQLTPKDRELGYQCDQCADAAEGMPW